jgi:signal transduction histidine kinase
MKGPDPLAGERPGGRPALPGVRTGMAIGAGPSSGAAGGAEAEPGRHQGRRSGRRAPARRAQPGKKARRADRRPARLSLSNWPVSARLVAVFAVASVTGVIFGGLRIADAIGTSDAYVRTAQLAILGEQGTALAQALEDERDVYSGVAAYSVLAAAAAADKAAPAIADPISEALTRESADLTAAEQNTDAAAQQTSSLAAAIGTAFPSSVQSKAANVVTMIDGIPGLRSELVGQPASQVIANYSNSIANIFVLNDEITSTSGDAELADDVQALGGLSRAKDEASQQQAFLYSALIEASVNDAGTVKRTARHPSRPPYNNIGLQALADSGGLSVLTTAQGLQFAELTAFDDAATEAQSNAYLDTVVGQPDDDSQLIEDFVSLTGDPRPTFEQIGGQISLGFHQATVADIWDSDMTTVIGQMRSIETQVAAAAVARSQLLEHDAIDSAVLTGAVTAGAILLVLLATALVGRSLVNPLRRLQTDALEIAAVRLPERVAAAAAGTDPAEGLGGVEPIGVRSTDEIGRVARAFDQVHAEAVRLAGNEAQLRGSLNAMFISLSRRSVPLIDRLARMIDGMEQNEDDPDQLANLFAMDHLVTRMRRNSENLLVLAGEEPVRKWTDSVPLADVTRAAASEIEQYGRVALAVQPGIMVSGQAAADVVHLLAELIENATLFSQQNTQVRVTVMELGTGGVLVEVRDDGVGVSPSRLADMNWRLDHPPALDVSISRHMGLYAVSRLASRHGIRVKLRPGTPQGLSALVWLPGTLATNERVPVIGIRSRPLGADGIDPVAIPRPAAPARQGAGRHRSGQRAASSQQPLVAAGGGQLARPATVWFAARRPSGGAARPQEELAAGWESTTGGWATTAGWAAAGAQATSYDASQAGGASGAPEQAGWTSSGLPRRVPRTSARPSAETPGSGMPVAVPDAGMPGAATPVLGAPAGGAAGPQGAPPYQDAPYQETPHQEAPSQDQVPPRRRSPEAARSRLSGFQLGSRDAVQAAHGPGRAPHPGEENSR